MAVTKTVKFSHFFLHEAGDRNAPVPPGMATPLPRGCARQQSHWTLLLGRGPPRWTGELVHKIPTEMGGLEDTAYRCNFGQKYYVPMLPNSEITRIKRARWLGMFKAKPT